ncbi:type IV pilus biogenesis/stability protein PilW [Dyella sp. M7H15-1]|uniref:type IV pilus biogenesis/stability protein PilW n=1 Tax=Dyella sp. M7H15-1 TaxID=2501295 RepID=UPI001004ED1C|nr:type IV pilus biogenesis/stability protein PilW [Dyella sp. M7H15-1]QAU22719.1 type IV pilus biogenesis/stability protein PilW [Dyella sp. M7H15-1]
MRRDRVLLGICLALALTGCHRSAVIQPPLANPDPQLPKQTKAEKAQSAADVHTRLAQHYIEIGKMEGALEKVKIAVSEDPTFVPAQTVMAYIYERINDMPNAEIHYRRAVELQPDKGDTNNNLGQFLCHEGKVREALPYFDKAIADPFYQTPDVAFANKGGCQLQINDRVGAEASLREAVKRNPGNPLALLQLTNLLYLNGRYFDASAFLQRFDALGQSNPDSLKLGYEIESHLGNTDAAHHYSKRLLSQFPDSEQAQALNQTVRP